MDEPAWDEECDDCAGLGYLEQEDEDTGETVEIDCDTCGGEGTIYHDPEDEDED
jgi:DnaJ-class molecular chaperone